MFPNFFCRGIFFIQVSIHHIIQSIKISIKYVFLYFLNIRFIQIIKRNIKRDKYNHFIRYMLSLQKQLQFSSIFAQYVTNRKFLLETTKRRICSLVTFFHETEYRLADNAVMSIVILRLNLLKRF